MAEATTITVDALTRGVRTTGPFEEVVARVREALAAQGFGVLTEIDVQATLAAKTGAQIDPYLILGACRPQLAEVAVNIEPRIGVLLPCNVVVRVDGEAVLVEALDPTLMATVVGGDEIAAVADEAGTRIDAALAAVAG